MMERDDAQVRAMIDAREDACLVFVQGQIEGLPFVDWGSPVIPKPLTQGGVETICNAPARIEEMIDAFGT